MTGCLSDEIVAQLVEGDLPLLALQAAQAHMATCHRCLDLVTIAAQSSLADPTPPALETGEERYALLHLHAEGGIGRVWLARDGALGREVALKELRPRFEDADDVRARFAEEARITGRLEHPGIVPVYELSRHGGSGRPYYAMRFIRGQTMADAIARHHRTRGGTSSLRGLLGAFVSVCNAVAYAHSRGVLHRDLKGQNVVLGDFGEVIVLDWGLAKAKEAPETAGPPSLADPARGETALGQVLGTPGYMAPEQAQGRTDLVDARSDLYSLGAILYEVLTGAPPHRGEDTKEVLRQTIQDPPRRPRLIAPGTPRALEAVCLKCLAKRREDRYDSVKDLAKEVGQYLSGEPVRAYRDPPLVRLQRWGRRHRTLVTSAAALLVTAMVALSMTAVLLRRANRRTEVERDEARRAVDTYLTQVSEEQLLKEQGLQPMRERLLRSALSFYQSFAEQHGSDPALRRDLAGAYRRVGVITIQLGKNDEARAALQKAIELYARLEKEEPGDQEARSGAGRSYLKFSYVQLQDGQPEQARAAAKEAARRFERLLAEHPQQAEHGRLLGRSYDLLASAAKNQFRYGEALRIYEQAFAVLSQTLQEAPDDLDARASLGELYRSIAALQQQLGNAKAQEEALLRSITIAEQLTAQEPGRSMFRADLARSLTRLGRLHFDLGRPTRAEAFQQRACKLVEQIVHDNPSVPVFERTHSDIQLRRGIVKTALGRTTEALPLLKKAVELEERVVGSYGGPVSGGRLAWRYFYLGSMAHELGDLGTALQALEKALELQRRAIEGASDSPTYRNDLRLQEERLGLVLLDAGRTTAAAQVLVLQRIMAEREALLKTTEATGAGADIQLRFEVAEGYLRLGRMRWRAGALAEAIAALGQALPMAEDIVRRQPQNLDFQRLQAEALAARGALLQTTDPAAARAAAQQAVAIAEELVREEPVYLFVLACHRALLSTLSQGSERARLQTMAVQALRQIVALGYDNFYKLRTDERLAPIRARADFQALLQRSR